MYNNIRFLYIKKISTIATINNKSRDSIPYWRLYRMQDIEASTLIHISSQVSLRGTAERGINVFRTLCISEKLW